nr:WD40 repeat domain-containing protein [Microcoleaceae cyanobacterium MO_207.B10]
MTRLSPNHSHNNSLGAANVSWLAIIGTTITPIIVIVGIIADGDSILCWFKEPCPIKPDNNATASQTQKTIPTPNSISTAANISEVSTFNKTPLHIEYVRSLAITPDGQTIVTGSSDNTIKVWDMATGNLKATLTGHSDSVRSVAISPDGQTIVSGSWDDTIKVWDLATGNLKATLTGHSSSVRSVAISPDGRTIVSGSWDETIKVWDLATGNLKATLSGHSKSLQSVAISPDGQT